MPIDRSVFGRTAILLLTLGFFALLAVTGTSIWLGERTRNFSDSLVRAQQALADTCDLQSILQDAETGQRGYLLTGDKEFLRPYTNAVARLPDQLKDLAELGRVDPVVRKHVDEISAMGRAKMAELASTIALAESGRRAEALAIVEGGRGRLIMDDARTVISEIRSHLDSRSESDWKLATASANYLLLATFLGSALILTVAVGAVWLVARYTRDLETAQAEVRAANASLEQRVNERVADLAFANAELEQASEEVQRFAYIVSHDLRAPLVNVMGFTSELEISLGVIRGLIEQVAETQPELITAETEAARTDLPEALGFIRSSTERMDRQINAILRISREGNRTLTPEPVAMETLIRNLASSVKHQLDQADARVDIETPIPGITADRLALEQIFGNLIDNAIKYLDPARPGRIVIRGRPEGGRIVYEVEDNGRGIAPADRERVFELFRRAGVQNQPGEGIGLAYVRATVRRLNGAVTCESQVGVGSTFRISLPEISRYAQKGAIG